MEKISVKIDHKELSVNFWKISDVKCKPAVDDAVEKPFLLKKFL